jgi:hypothetical protein
LRSRPLLGSRSRAAGLRTRIGPPTPRRCHGVRTRRCLFVGDGVLHGHWPQPPRGSRRKRDLEEVGRTALRYIHPIRGQRTLVSSRPRSHNGEDPALREHRRRGAAVAAPHRRTSQGRAPGHSLAAVPSRLARPQPQAVLPPATRLAPTLANRRCHVATRRRRGRRNPRSRSRRRSPSRRGHAIEHELRVVPGPCEWCCSPGSSPSPDRRPDARCRAEPDASALGVIAAASRGGRHGKRRAATAAGIEVRRSSYRRWPWFS